MHEFSRTVGRGIIEIMLSGMACALTNPLVNKYDSLFMSFVSKTFLILIIQIISPPDFVICVRMHTQAAPTKTNEIEINSGRH